MDMFVLLVMVAIPGNPNSSLLIQLFLSRRTFPDNCPQLEKPKGYIMNATNRLTLAGAILLSLAACHSETPPPPAPVAATDRASSPPSSCPDTPPGTKVGPMGCPCEMTVQLQFKSDTAALTPADQARLDQVAENLTRLHWVSGTIEG